MRKAILLYIALVISFSAFAQSDDLIYCFNQQQNTINIDFKKIGYYYERLHLLYNISNDDRFLVSSSDENGLFYIAANDENLADSLLEETFVSFLNEKNEEFNSFDKIEISEKENIWKLGIPDRDMVSLTLDYMIEITPKGDNYLCINAEPFCTDDGTYTFSAMTGYEHSGEPGPYYSCLSSQPCPSWYYMRIANPGSFVIHMEGKDGHDQKDIDFCCWGPFDDPAAPCPYGLTADKVVDCSYSGSYSENCDIPSSAQTGEYYILMITNYSRETCIITFAKNALSGPGTTDCSIMPPIIDALNPCYGETMQLTAQDVNNASYAWTGPNGFASNVREPSISNVTFANSGTYTCVMTIPGQGSSEPISIDVEILPTLNANFDIEDPCNGGFVKFIGLETTTPPDYNDKITEYRWNFGDGTDDELGQNIEHRYTAPGTYIVHYTITAENEAGGTCEDEFVKAITIGFGGEMRYDDVICYGENYNKHGFNYTRPRPGTIYDTIIKPATYGCDSTITLRLIVGNVYDTQIFDTVCFGEIYKAHEFFLDSLPLGDTVVSKQDVTQYGCDSIVTLYLNVAPTYLFEITDSICFGEDYNDYGFRIPRPDVGFDTYTNSFLTKQKCDSIWRLNLYVNPTYNLEFNGQICEGEDFLEFGFDTINPPVGKHVIQKEMKTLSGCDSIRTLALIVGKVYDTIIHDSICYGNDYNQNGFNIKQPAVGMTYDTLFKKTTLKCDSIIYLELRVDPIYDIDLFDTICLGEEYHGYNFDTVPIKAGFILMEKSLLTVNGCDSLVKLNLTVNETFITNLTDTICFGENYIEHGFNIINPGVGIILDSILNKTIYDCDSMVCLELYVAPLYDTTFFDTICFGNSYHGHGFDIDSTALQVGINHDTLFLQSVCFCDSVVKLELYVAPVHDTTFYDTICYGDEYHGHGFNYDSLGIGMKYDTLFLQTLLHCDSTVMLELYVAPSYHTHYYDTITLGEDYHGHGFDTIQPEPGLCLMQREYFTTLGCDSIFTMHLMVGSTYFISLTDTNCYGERYTEYGFDLDSLEIGIHHDTLFLKSILGRDSIVSLELTVVPSYLIGFTDTICYMQSYHGHGFDIDSTELEGGLNYDTLFLFTTLECDSIITLELYVAPLYNVDLYDTICQGEEYHQHGFHIIGTNTGWNIDTLYLYSKIGCDSTVVMHLFVGKTYDPHFTDTICYGQTYYQHGFYLDSLEVGFHHDTLYLQSILGCDSIASLELYVAPIYDTTFFDTICHGQSYFEHGFEVENPDLGWNQRTRYLSTTLWCDSIVRLELYVAPVYDIELFDTICYGEDYHEYNFDTINPAAGMCVMQQQLTTLIGCDSIVTMNLLVGEVYDVNFTDTICYGEDYHEHGFEFDDPEVGFHNDTLFLQSVLSCDSTVMLELYVAPIYDTTFFDTICYGQNYHEHGFELENLPVGWDYETMELSTTLGCDSILNLELYVAPVHDIDLFDTICYGEDYHEHGFDFVLPEPGMHYDYKYLTTAIGCDSIVTMNLLVGEVYDNTIKDSICYGENYNKYNFHLNVPEVGTHTDTQSLSSIHGCDSIVRLNLFVAPVYQTDVIDSICEGENYTKYGLNLIEPAPGLYDLTSALETQYGCDSVFDVNLKVINMFVPPELIYGMCEVVVATDMITGIYHYHIDSIPGCMEYRWSISGMPWEVTQDKYECTILVTCPGIGTITVEARNSCGDVSQSLEIHAGYFGVGENETTGANIYPNPARDMVNIESKNIKEVNIISTLGIKLRKEEFNMDDKVSIDLTGLPSSLYLLEVITTEGRVLKRVTVDNN